MNPSRWRDLYRKRLTTPEYAVAAIRSGERVFVGSNCAEPQDLVEALTACSDRLADTEIVHILTLGIAPYSDEQLCNQFRHNAFFIGPNVRRAVNELRADYTPIFLSEVPDLFRNGQVPLDHALVQVSPPDAHGYCSLGIAVDVVRTAIECASHITAEVNPNMPRTHGDSMVHVSAIDAFVEGNRPILELPSAKQSEITQRIGRHIADLIEDGSTLQMGIGAIPDAVLACLGEKHNLGVHTEMFSDGLIELVEAGVIDGSRKKVQRGKIVTSFCMGTRKLYDFVHDNPAVEFRPTEYVNDPFVISQNEKMVAINAAIEVDLTGQVCADSIGEVFYSGIGGQVDFIRGAARSVGGKPIIALPSTAHMPDGRTISRIVSTLKPGAGVVTSRGDVHYVVTEWGVAYLHGKSIRERALALIRIAHPDFRAELLEAAKGRHLAMADQTAAGLIPHYPDELEERIELRNGVDALMRPIRATDEDILREFHYSLSDESVYRRYNRPLRSLPHSERTKLVNIDYTTQMAIIVVRSEGARDEMLGVGRYFVDETTRMAELAFVVRDDWHGHGIGTAILRKLISISRASHLSGLDAYCQPDNVTMAQLFMRYGFAIVDQDRDTRHFRLMLGQKQDAK